MSGNSSHIAIYGSPSMGKTYFAINYFNQQLFWTINAPELHVEQLSARSGSIEFFYVEDLKPVTLPNADFCFIDYSAVKGYDPKDLGNYVVEMSELNFRNYNTMVYDEFQNLMPSSEKMDKKHTFLKWLSNARNTGWRNVMMSQFPQLVSASARRLATELILFKIIDPDAFSVIAKQARAFGGFDYEQRNAALSKREYLVYRQQ